jgi:hypothetical protein
MNFKGFEEYDKDAAPYVKGSASRRHEFARWILAQYSWELPVEDLVSPNYLIRNFTQRHFRKVEVD